MWIRSMHIIGIPNANVSHYNCILTPKDHAGYSDIVRNGMMNMRLANDLKVVKESAILINLHTAIEQLYINNITYLKAPNIFYVI